MIRNMKLKQHTVYKPVGACGCCIAKRESTEEVVVEKDAYTPGELIRVKAGSEANGRTVSLVKRTALSCKMVMADYETICTGVCDINGEVSLHVPSLPSTCSGHLISLEYSLVLDGERLSDAKVVIPTRIYNDAYVLMIAQSKLISEKSMISQSLITYQESKPDAPLGKIGRAHV